MLHPALRPRFALVDDLEIPAGSSLPLRSTRLPARPDPVSEIVADAVVDGGTRLLYQAISSAVTGLMGQALDGIYRSPRRARNARPTVPPRTRMIVRERPRNA